MHVVSKFVRKRCEMVYLANDLRGRLDLNAEKYGAAGVSVTIDKSVVVTIKTHNILTVVDISAYLSKAIILLWLRIQHRKASDGSAQANLSSSYLFIYKKYL
jgi:hypothetical protein